MPINIISEIVPFSDFPVTRDDFIAGGFRTVKTRQEMQEIPKMRRKAGMLVYVQDEQRTYRLADNLIVWGVASEEGGVTIAPISVRDGEEFIGVEDNTIFSTDKLREALNSQSTPNVTFSVKAGEELIGINDGVLFTTDKLRDLLKPAAVDTGVVTINASPTEELLLVDNDDPKHPVVVSSATLKSAVNLAQKSEQIENKVELSADATSDQYPNAKSVYDYISSIFVGLSAGYGWKPKYLNLESSLVAPGQDGDFYLIQYLDKTAPGHSGMALWTGSEFKVFVNRYNSPDGESIVINSTGQIKVDPEWLANFCTTNIVSEILNNTPDIDTTAFELKTNRVPLSENVTSDQYPDAKSVWNHIQQITEAVGRLGQDGDHNYLQDSPVPDGETIVTDALGRMSVAVSWLNSIIAAHVSGVQTVNVDPNERYITIDNVDPANPVLRTTDEFLGVVDFIAALNTGVESVQSVDSLVFVNNDDPANPFIESTTALRNAVTLAQGAEQKSNKVALSATSTANQYPNAASVWAQLQAAINTVPSTGLKIPLPLERESELDELSATAKDSDHYYIQEMDVTAPGHTGVAWYNDGSFHTLFDRYGVPDNSSIVLNATGQLSVSSAWRPAWFSDHTSSVAAHGATPNNISGRIISRDSNGKAYVSTPLSTDPPTTIVTKGYLDAFSPQISYASTDETVARSVENKAVSPASLVDFALTNDIDVHTNQTSAHNATSEALAGRMMIRDSQGRSQVLAPVADLDIANKKYVDNSATKQLLDGLQWTLKTTTTAGAQTFAMGNKVAGVLMVCRNMLVYPTGFWTYNPVNRLLSIPDADILVDDEINIFHVNS